MDLLAELKAAAEADLQAASARVKAYVKGLETLVEASEAEVKSHWVTYTIVAFVAAIIGHVV